MMEKQKNVPVLRFPEFSGEWELKKLGNYFIERNETAKGQFPLYSLTIENGIIPKSARYEREFLVDNVADAYKVMYPDDFAFNPMNLRFGALAKHKENLNVSVSRYYNIFYCNEKGDSSFFDYYLTSYNLIQYYNKMATGSLMEKKRVHYLDFIHFKKHLPSLPEQQKIASFLKTIDDKLQSLKKKKTLLEQYKKGMMQKIFSQELRFKDNNGAAFPKWEKKKLGEVADKIMYGMNAAAIEYDGVNKYLRITDIDENTRAFLPNPLTSPNGIIEEKYHLYEGDLVFARTGASVGKSYLYNKKDGNLYFAGFLIKFSITKANPYFIYTQTLRESYNKWIQLMSMRSGQPGVNAEEYKTFSFSLPCLEEQTKIANFLSVIDDKINLCNMQIEKTEQWKKGLLQKMFV